MTHPSHHPTAYLVASFPSCRYRGLLSGSRRRAARIGPAASRRLSAWRWYEFHPRVLGLQRLSYWAWGAAGLI